jgi:uncharacterized membrane protein
MLGMLPLRDPLAVVAALLAIEAMILFLAEWKYARGLFKYVPSMFWIYFLPMVAGTAGVLPPEKDSAGNVTATYGLIGTYCLPASLVLLLISVDLKAILKLGRTTLLVMLAGSLGIIVGGPLVLMLYKPFVPESIRETIWKGFGALSGSWIGGSANMLAVGKGIEAPSNVYSPMVVVDTICPYAWMCLLIILSRYQAAYDRWNRSEDSLVKRLKSEPLAGSGGRAEPLTLKHVGLMMALAALATWAALELAAAMPPVKNLINAKAWSLILATAIGIALSFTPVRRLERYGASRIGYALLYFVLASIGATTTLAHLAAAPVLLVAGFTWLLIHAAFIIGAARLLKVPMSLTAAASQANIGGPASAPVLAEVYLPGLAPVGLLLAVFGNLIGTYLGLVCSSLCKLVNAW